MAHRFHEELPDSEMQIFQGAGHFVWDDEPERATGALVDFLERRCR
jgi:pimeloyl-ACP methyl ester carboxylesterase